MTTLHSKGRPAALGIAAIITVAAAFFAALAGWMYFGSSILLAAASEGLSWCF